ncbi:MAG: diaminopimelate epimerase [candidate division NC10 bacterium]|nr:diaminopimelate epimerase [candidate division NC10 bacterium]
MGKLTFYKMSGSGNDFVLIDNRGKRLDQDPQEFARKICHRQLSVGADGLILLEPSEMADFKMRIINADGSEAEMCGNGGRCIARLAHMLGVANERMAFETLAGLIRAEVRGARVKLQMVKPYGLRLNLDIPISGSRYTVHSINTGVPHAILFTQDLDRAPVFELGRKLRYHEAFQPAGTNVDFVQVTGPNAIRIRTYERGVEDETFACGTGATASALIAASLGRVTSPVAVTVRSGERLTVYFEERDGTFEEVFFEGEVRLVCHGELWEEAWNY